MKKMKHLRELLALCLFALSLSGCIGHPPAGFSGRIMVLSLSTDGGYAISSSISKHVVLWNIKEKTWKMISDDANIYSVYFIKGTHKFIYQRDKDNEVFLKNIHGKTLKRWNPGFPTYGEAMTSDLEKYIAMDKDDQVFIMQNNKLKQLIYNYCGPNYQKPPPPKGMPAICGDFFGDMKLSNITISKNEKYFVTSGFDDVLIWDLKKMSLIKHLLEDDAQTVAIISNDEKFVISADVASRGYKYNITDDTGKHFYYEFGKYADLKEFKNNRDYTNLTGIPAIKYIDDSHLLVFHYGIPHPFYYATLYDTHLKQSTVYWKKGYYKDSLYDIKHIPILSNNVKHDIYGNWLTPITNSYLRGQAIDTAPKAHLLVMAQTEDNGIMVYRYDPNKQTLKEIWSPVIYRWSL